MTPRARARIQIAAVDRAGRRRLDRGQWMRPADTGLLPSAVRIDDSAPGGCSERSKARRS